MGRYEIHTFGEDHASIMDMTMDGGKGHAIRTCRTDYAQDGRRIRSAEQKAADFLRERGVYAFQIVDGHDRQEPELPPACQTRLSPFCGGAGTVREYPLDQVVAETSFRRTFVQCDPCYGEAMDHLLLIDATRSRMVEVLENGRG